MWITIQKQLKIKYFEDKFGYVRNLEYAERGTCLCRQASDKARLNDTVGQAISSLNEEIASPAQRTNPPKRNRDVATFWDAPFNIFSFSFFFFCRTFADCTLMK